MISGKSNTEKDKENQGASNNIKPTEDSHKTKLADKAPENIAQALFSSPPKISPFLQQALQKSQAEAHASDSGATLMTGMKEESSATEHIDRFSIDASSKLLTT